MAMTREVRFWLLAEVRAHVVECLLYPRKQTLGHSQALTAFIQIFYRSSLCQTLCCHEKLAPQETVA